jgi:hypothetical protein
MISQFLFPPAIIQFYARKTNIRRSILSPSLMSAYLNYTYISLCDCWSEYLQILMLLTDLREDKHYLMDHPGLVPVTTAQVYL